jgi:carbamoyl-phosphate synthase large subunit
VLDVIDHERNLTGEPPIVLLTFGGQTAIDLAKDLAYAGVPIAGLSAEAIETTEDRERFANLLDRLGLQGPRGQLAGDAPALHAAIEELGLPIIVRPSWVIGGRGIAVLRSAVDVEAYLRTEVGWPLRVDELVQGVELDVDAIADGERWCVPGILEQIEPPGVHSGDSVAVLPPQGLQRAVQEDAAAVAGRIALALGLKGVLNVQMIAAADGRLIVIEANPRASRTVPIVAKATGRDVVAAAVRCALGSTLLEAGLQPGLAPDGPMVAVKAPVDSLWRLPGVDTQLGPEMRSTGEVLGLAAGYEDAMRAAQEAVAAHR